MNENQSKIELTSARLKLRHWRPSDLDAFAQLNADPRVMEYFPSLMSSEESNALAEKIVSQLETQGFGFWAVEVIGGAPFIGFTGLNVPSFTAPFTPCVEIGWRLAFPFWGKGYATEAAEA